MGKGKGLSTDQISWAKAIIHVSQWGWAVGPIGTAKAMGDLRSLGLIQTLKGRKDPLLGLM